MSNLFEKKKLEKEFSEFIEVLSKYECWVAGGAITSLFTNSKINDFDIYFKNKKELSDLLYDLEGEFTLMSHTNKATLISRSGQDAQLIRFRYFDNTDEIFDTFDFTACMGAYSPKEDKFYFHDDFMKHNSQKILVFNPKTAFPYISMLRVDKYKQKGYRISKPELTKIMLACSSKKIESYEDAVEQLGGMYGNNISNLIKENETFSIERMYDLLSCLDVNDSDFDMPNGVDMPSEDVASLIENGKIKVCKMGKNYYKIINGEYCHISDYFGKSEDKFNEMIKTGFAEEVDVKTLVKVGAKLYKYVGKSGDDLYSLYRKQFKYKIGEIVDGGLDGIYNLGENMNSTHHYSSRDGAVLIELEVVESSNPVGANSDGIRYDKLKVIRIVPKEEYKTEEV